MLCCRIWPGGCFHQVANDTYLSPVLPNAVVRVFTRSGALSLEQLGLPEVGSNVHLLEYCIVMFALF